ncbi:MAG: AMP-binding protein [Gammaproteobacteria bacterium]|nr:AMP-binding protein [Gammaproteobacteria bacterium]NNL51314.1 AMP-binding protein [Woeseiaceae bacterium]
MLEAARIVGLHPVNSVDFVANAFRVFDSGDVLAILKQHDTDLPIDHVVTPAPGGGWLELTQKVNRNDCPAQIVFTSGTEGEAKAILLSHGALADVVDRLNSIMKLDSTVSEYIGVPVTHSFGFGRCRAVAAVGGRCYIPEKGFNPVELASMLKDDTINAVSAVPTMWRLVLARPEVIGDQGRKVKWIEIGSQFMSAVEKEQMKKLFPNAIIIQHYGLTEASRATLLDISATRGELLESVGRATDSVAVKISDTGRIMIRGPNVASGQVIAGKVKSLTGTDGWYTTADLGRLDRDFLFFEGRADDQINCAGIKVNPDLLQAKIDCRLGVKNKVAVAGFVEKLRGEGFFVAIEAGTGISRDEVQDAVDAELLLLGIDARSSVRVREVPKIPRTDTGKVRRRQLTRRYADLCEETSAPRSPVSRQSIPAMFAEIFPNVEVRARDTFKSLGGDSLNYVQMLMLLENHLGFVPPGWDRATVTELQKLPPKHETTFYTWLDTTIFLRVLAILAVVATHSGGAVLGGGTLLLFVLIGFNMARFKMATLINGDVWQWVRTFASIILIPYYVFALLYLGWNKSFEPDVLLLYANLVSAKITVTFPFWFVQVLIQCLLVIGIIFSVPALRRFAARSTVSFSLWLLMLFIGIRAVYPYFWDTTYLINLVPLRFMAILWLGWCFCVVETFRHRLLLAIIGVGFAILDTGLSTMTAWLAFGSLFLAFVPRVPIPAFSRQAFSDIGSATFYIFAFNGIIIFALSHMQIESGAVVFSISLAGSIFIWWLLERFRFITNVKTLFGNRAGQDGNREIRPKNL